MRSSNTPIQVSTLVTSMWRPKIWRLPMRSSGGKRRGTWSVEVHRHPCVILKTDLLR